MIKKRILMGLIISLLAGAGCNGYSVQYDIERVDMSKNTATVEVWVLYEYGFRRREYIHYGEYTIGFDTLAAWKLKKDKDCEQVIEAHKRLIEMVEEGQ